MQASYLTASLSESDQIKENQHLTMAWTVGKGCRSLGLGNLGIRSSGLMFIWKHWIKRILKTLTLKMKAQWHLSAMSYFFYYLIISVERYVPCQITLILGLRGQRYKSKHLSKRSLMKRLYAGTKRRLEYFWGKKFILLSSGSMFCHFSSYKHTYLRDHNMYNIPYPSNNSKASLFSKIIRDHKLYIPYPSNY